MKATDLNIYVLKAVMGTGQRCEARFPPTRLPHLRRCVIAARNAAIECGIEVAS